MPRTSKELGGLPAPAVAVWNDVVSRSEKAGDSTVVAIKKAWAAVKRGWTKRGDKWVKKS